MLHNLFQFGFAGLTALSILLAWLSRQKRAVFVFCAITAACAAIAAHYFVFWALAVFALGFVWSLFCAGNWIDLAWRVKTGFVLFLALGAALAIYPTYFDERWGRPQDDATMSADEKAEIDTAMKHGEKGFGAFLRSNIPFRLVRGLDLKGGLRLVYLVDVEEAIKDRRDNAYDNLRGAFARAFGFHTGDTTPSVEEYAKLPTKVKLEKSRDQVGVIKAEFVDPKDSAVVNDKFMADNHFDKELSIVRSGDQKTLTFRIKSDVESSIRNSAVDLAKETVHRRIDSLGLREAATTVRDESIIIEVPGEDEKQFAEIRALISQTARLEFKMVDDDVNYMKPIQESAKASDLPQGLRFQIEDAPVGPKKSKANTYAMLVKGPQEDMRAALARFKTWTATLPVDSDHEIGFEKVPQYNPDKDTYEDIGWRTYYLYSKAEITGDMVASAAARPDQSERGLGGWQVQMELKDRGAQIFEDITGRNIGRRFAIILDGKVESAPRINGKIPGGHCVITMGSSSPEQQLANAKNLELVLKSGALPAPISPSNEQRIGPSLGKDAIGKGMRGAAFGMALVLIFMVVYYSRAGLIANIAVSFNLVLQVALMAMLSQSMTLPGIAGLALTVGIAVDANVLINERIREELRQGKSARAAVDVGYDKAFSAILDGHITTMISSLILWQFGTGPIKGFAVTLFYGVCVSLFTGVVCTRLMFDWAVRHRRARKLYLG